MFKITTSFIALCPILLWATEFLHPVHAPASAIHEETSFELNEDIYSLDEIVSIEYAPWDIISFYADGSFRFLSYSYEFSTEGYIHNYCNMHVNGFNETYAGLRTMVWHNTGLDISWRFPPGEGSQINRFHRLNVEPFTLYHFSRNLVLGTSFRYNTFLEDSHYKPGDEVGIKASFVWKFWINKEKSSSWQLSEVFLYQERIEESENRNLVKPYSHMKDMYRGMKINFNLVRYFNIFSLPVGLGMNYEIHKGTLFGFETGHKIGIRIQIQ